MIKNTASLISALENFAPVKSASDKSAGVTIPADPAVQGAKPDVPAELLVPAGPAGDGETAKLPEIAAGDPAGAEKVPCGGNAGEVPAAQPFVEDGKIANIDGLRQKLAAIGVAAPKPPEAPKAPAPPKAPKAPEAPEAPEAPAVPELPKSAAEVAPFSYHLVFNAMCKSASGRESIQDALSEIYGNDKAAAMVKQSLAEQEAYEVSYIQEQLNQLEQEKIASLVRQEDARQGEVLDGLLKTASNGEHREAIYSSFTMLKKAEHSLIDNPILHHSFCVGTNFGEKVAMAMQGDPSMMEDPGMVPEMAAQEGPPGPEELLAALEELVMEGQLTEEQAMQIAEEILGGGMGMEGEDPNMPKAASAEDTAADEHLTKVAEYIESLVGTA